MAAASSRAVLALGCRRRAAIRSRLGLGGEHPRFAHPHR